MSQRMEREQEAYKNFVNSMNSVESKKTYIRCLSKFMGFIKVETFEQLLDMDTKTVESKIRDFIIFLRDERKLAGGTVNVYVAAITHFYDCQLHSEINIRWKKLRVFQRRSHKVVDDNPYRREQIQRLLELTDLRGKIIILLMCSGGLRRAAIPELKVGDLVPISQYNIYKIIVYNNTESRYITYCTPECRKYIDQYLEWRSRLGEKVNDNSPLIRKQFDAHALFEIRNPKPISYKMLDYMMRELLHKSGIRQKMIMIDNKCQRYRSKLMECHGMRKFFETSAKLAGMDTLYLKRLMGQKTGLEDAYFKPSEEDLLVGNDKMIGYAGVLNDLTINEEYRLRMKVDELRAKKNQIELMESKHNEEIKAMRDDMNQIMSLIRLNPKLAKVKPEALMKKV